MNDIKQRVARCFANVFSGILPDQVPTASTASLSAWDSLGHVRLLAAVEEEFGIQWEMDDFDELTSYALIVARLEKKPSNG